MQNLETFLLFSLSYFISPAEVMKSELKLPTEQKYQIYWFNLLASLLISIASFLGFYPSGMAFLGYLAVGFLFLVLFLSLMTLSVWLTSLLFKAEWSYVDHQILSSHTLLFLISLSVLNYWLINLGLKFSLLYYLIMQLISLVPIVYYVISLKEIFNRWVISSSLIWLLSLITFIILIVALLFGIWLIIKVIWLNLDISNLLRLILAPSMMQNF